MWGGGMGERVEGGDPHEKTNPNPSNSQINIPSKPFLTHELTYSRKPTSTTPKPTPKTNKWTTILRMNLEQSLLRSRVYIKLRP